MLFAEIPPDANVSTWVNNGLVGVLILLLGYFVRYLIPKLLDDFRADVKQINQINADAVKALGDQTATTILRLETECRTERKETTQAFLNALESKA